MSKPITGTRFGCCAQAHAIAARLRTENKAAAIVTLPMDVRRFTIEIILSPTCSLTILRLSPLAYLTGEGPLPIFSRSSATTI